MSLKRSPSPSHRPSDVSDTGVKRSVLERQFQRWKRDIADVEERLKTARAAERLRLLRLQRRLRQGRPLNPDEGR